MSQYAKEWLKGGAANLEVVHVPPLRRECGGEAVAHVQGRVEDGDRQVAEIPLLAPEHEIRGHAVHEGAELNVLVRPRHPPSVVGLAEVEGELLQQLLHFIRLALRRGERLFLGVAAPLHLVGRGAPRVPPHAEDDVRVVARPVHRGVARRAAGDHPRRAHAAARLPPDGVLVRAVHACFRRTQKWH